MPSRRLEDSHTAPHGVGAGLSLKRHKVLPHPRQHRLDSDVEHSQVIIPSSMRPLSVATEASPVNSSANSSPRTLKHAARRIDQVNLPPTPPSHSRQSSAGDSAAAKVLRPYTPDKLENPSQLLQPRTPPNQQSPFTPDLTPPKSGSRSIALRPLAGSRYPSSRAESFKTAPEFPDTDDEMSTIRPELPSARPSEIDVSGKVPKPVGLGLDLECEVRSSPSLGLRNGAASSNARNDFESVGGEWSGSSQGDISEVEGEWDANLMRNVTVRRRPNRVSYIYDDTPLKQVLDDQQVAPTNATEYLRQFPQDNIATKPWDRDSEITPKRKPPMPLSVTKIELPDFPSPADLRRVSTASRSGSSTIKDNMMLDSPPVKQRTLRHTRKYVGLRDFNSDISGTSSRVVSTSSVDRPHRLVHTAKNRDLRNSLGSAVTSCTSPSEKSHRDGSENGSVQAASTSDQKFSTKAPPNAPSLSSKSSRHTKRSTSLSSAPLSGSSRSNEAGFFEWPPKRIRRLSESASSHSPRTIDYPPSIPVRRSSLSAPTSRNTSRAGSLTAESLNAHNLLQSPPVKTKSPMLEAPSTMSFDPHHVPRTHRIGSDQTGDPLFGNRLSVQPTPFSQYSYETNGTAAELSEAMLMSIFPHQNKSIRMVQHQGSNSSPTESVPRTELFEQGLVADAPKPEAKEALPLTPTQPIEDATEMDSPFRNPREPPQPPIFKVIPPTPAALTPSGQVERQLGHDYVPEVGDSKPKRGFSLRRALANRRHSDSFIPRALSLKRASQPSNQVSRSTQTSKGQANLDPPYPSVSDKPADGSKLHPFWRPARFWDDLEDYDTEYSDEEYDQVHTAYPAIDNRPQPPKRSLSGSLKRTFAVLPVQPDPYYAPKRTDRRTVRRSQSGNLRVVRNRGSSDSLRYNGRYMAQVQADQRPSGNIVSGWKDLSRRLSERRKEKRKDKMRRTISGPRDVVNDTNDVLRSRKFQGRYEVPFHQDVRGEIGENGYRLLY